MTQFFEMVLLQFIQEANEESCDYVAFCGARRQPVR